LQAQISQELKMGYFPIDWIETTVVSQAVTLFFGSLLMWCDRSDHCCASDEARAPIISSFVLVTTTLNKYE